jgi:hypothetical protein
MKCVRDVGCQEDKFDPSAHTALMRCQGRLAELLNKQERPAPLKPAHQRMASVLTEAAAAAVAPPAAPAGAAKTPPAPSHRVEPLLRPLMRTTPDTDGLRIADDLLTWKQLRVALLKVYWAPPFELVMQLCRELESDGTLLSLDAATDRILDWMADAEASETEHDGTSLTDNIINLT